MLQLLCGAPSLSSLELLSFTLRVYRGNTVGKRWPWEWDFRGKWESRENFFSMETIYQGIIPKIKLLIPLRSLHYAVWD